MRKTISRIFGKLVSIKYPKIMQNYINKTYVKHFNIPLDEFKDYKEYDSLLALFTRRLIKPREFESGFISPCDGTILSYAKSSNLKAFSIKGKDYDIKELLGFTPKNELDFLNIYLSPRDYHNYHSPCNMQVLNLKYFCAELFSVNLKALSKHDNLYSRNERVVLTCKKDNGDIFYMVFVGAVNVGKMEFDFDTSVQTNMKNASDYEKNYDNVSLKKGEMLGRFLMGSTILILGDDLKLECQVGAIKFGQRIAND
ncbi:MULTISPECIES: phosphatidylserine decarboxylase [unclassified Campylobacter]|uniref:phosphatidylserine decarboxylase n=1 Tax=unclassified Campylobacter TaxID=2593542 RepID=UPI001BDA3E65|nr:MULTISPECIES: phosphatidylserine decarboxylase [unclassified Campylobacter]MBT0880909.1 phosphatidylserine decarboxylase [Campylobacter sp. 2018MI27]MBT0885612.1 phosphatidylserine decarboxylase [Campylobacter sp. 2018MI10]ULO03219.1 phosphatidylserine decarboxylase, proenzyme [Campylobacter sp. RM12651]